MCVRVKMQRSLKCSSVGDDLLRGVQAFSTLRCRSRQIHTYGLGRREQERQRAKLHMTQAVWAFDFDGVVCDSVGESSEAAWKAAARVWPDIFKAGVPADQKSKVLKQMRTARPVIETGYENVVQVRCLLEGESVENILENWHDLLPEYMQRWGLERSKLVDIFGTTRDDWMADDLEDWLHKNSIYEGLPNTLQHAIQQDELYIVTTKQARFTEALLKDMAGIDFPADRIFSQAESGRPKTEVLAMLQDRHPSTKYHFIEDKLGTLEKVIEQPALEKWALYLVDWGYNTQKERQRAADTGKIEVITKSRLDELVRSS